MKLHAYRDKLQNFRQLPVLWHKRELDVNFEDQEATEGKEIDV
jgi:hypothetical protein